MHNAHFHLAYQKNNNNAEENMYKCLIHKVVFVLTLQR